MNKSKAKRGNYEIEDLGDFELPAALHETVKEMTAAADLELEETRVNFRWQKEPLSVIKRVAHAMGVPYQTYMKQVLYRQALEDLGKIQATITPPSPGYIFAATLPEATPMQAAMSPAVPPPTIILQETKKRDTNRA